MADYGLIQGLAEGLKSGVQGYQQQKALNRQTSLEDEDRKRNADMLALHLAQAGYQKNPQSGGLEPTPEAKAQREFEAKKRVHDEQTYDPTAPVNQLYHQTAEQFGLKNIPEGLIAPDYEKVLPLQEKFQQNQIKQQEVANNRKAQASAKNDNLSLKLVEGLKNDLDPNKARGGNLAANQKQVDRATHLQGLINTYHDRNLDSRETEELAIGLQSLLSQGNPAAGQVAALVPKSAIGDSAKLKEWLFNEPRGTNQQAFIERIGHSIDRQKQISEEQVKRAQVQRLSAHGRLKEIDPDTYGAILNSYGITPEDVQKLTPGQQQGLIQAVASNQGGGLINSAQAAAPSPHPQDNEAVQWAKKNPGDPRAKAILQANGVQ